MKLVLSSKPKENIFTTSGTFTVPNGVNQIEVFCVGGGGPGGEGWWHSETSNYGNGGGSGYTTTGTIDTSSNKTISIAIGVGGQFYYNSGWVSRSAGTSSAGSISAKGGSGGVNGGSAGGNGQLYSDERTDNGNGPVKHEWATNGASDGNSTSYHWWDAYWNVGYSGDKELGKGQGTTTRAFGEQNGTLYAGGGGGGWATGEYGTGYGGDGGGGNGAKEYSNPTQGNAGTGGGGGGGCGWKIGSSSSMCYGYGADGGSGCVIIRW